MKRGEVGRTKKNPRCKYYKSLCKFISSLKIVVHVGWRTFVTTCFLSRLHIWEFMWQETKEPKHRTKHKHSDISTKEGPEENQWGYNRCIQSWSLNVQVMFTCQSNDPSEFIQIYQLILIKFDTCMYRISRRISFKPFLPTCFLGTKFIQESNTVMTLVLLKIVELEIRKSLDFMFYLFIF